MKLTESDYQECWKYCKRRSWRVRLWPVASERAMRDALDLKVLNPGYSANTVEKKLSVATRERYPRNFALVWLLIRYVLPILIKFVIEWWKTRQIETQSD